MMTMVLPPNAHPWLRGTIPRARRAVVAAAAVALFSLTIVGASSRAAEWPAAFERYESLALEKPHNGAANLEPTAEGGTFVEISGVSILELPTKPPAGEP